MENYENLQNEKLKAEINLINARIKKDYPELKPRKWYEKFAAFLKNWQAVMLALIALGGGIFGIFRPVKLYFDEQRKAVQFNLNESMIKAMDNLESADWNTRTNAIIILSYYDLNAIPIFLDKLAMADRDNPDIKDEYIEAINLLYDRRKDDVFKQILLKMEYCANEVSPKREKLMLQLCNLSDLIQNLNLTEVNKSDVKELYDDIGEKFNKTDTILKSIDGSMPLQKNIELFYSAMK
jgi:hypothetical protein